MAKTTVERPWSAPFKRVSNLAAGWYAALPSDDLHRSPRRVELFGRSFVAWRTDDGLPVIMPAACPHMGAALFDGTVVDGTLRCPFHHWRFDASGRCTHVPGGRPPAGAITPPLLSRESSGYVWAWYGLGHPPHEPPDVPELQSRRREGLRHFRLADETQTTVRRILENTYDPDHLVALHGLTVNGRTDIQLTRVASFEADNGQPVERLDAHLTWPSYSGTLGRVSSALGLNADIFELKVQGWATCQRIQYFADGRRVYDMVLATTPLSEGRSIQHINVAIDFDGRGPAGWVRSLVHRAEVTAAARQDLPIFDTLLPGDRHGIYVLGDEALRKFRQFYQQWVGDARDVD